MFDKLKKILSRLKPRSKEERQAAWEEKVKWRRHAHRMILLQYAPPGSDVFTFNEDGSESRINRETGEPENATPSAEEPGRDVVTL